MSEQKLIDELSDELAEVNQMGGDVDALKSPVEEEETLEAGEQPEDEDTEDLEEGDEPDDEPDTSKKPAEKKVVQEQPKTPDKSKATERFNRSRGNLRKDFDSFKDEVKGTLTEILGAIKSGALSKKEGAEQIQEVQDELDAYAEKHKLDPTGIKELVGIIEKRIKPVAKAADPAHEERPEEEEEEGDDIEYNAVEESKVFDEEWLPIEVKIREQYPNATPKQILAAKRAMDDLAHSSAELAKQDLDYILSKHPKTFSELLFSPKKKGGESGSLGTAEEEAEEKGFNFDANNMSPKKAAALESMLDEAAEDNTVEVMRDGEKVKV